MIYLTSDWHLKKENTEILSLLSDTTREDTVIILGDLADEWNQKEDQIWFVEQMNQYKAEILLVDGNHEDFKKLNIMPERIWHGIKVHQMGERVYHALRGQVLYLENKSFWIMGGGYSGTGYISRHPDRWQEEETPSKEERQRGLEALLKMGGQVDYILTHTAPQAVITTYELSEDFNGFNEYLDEIAKVAKFKKWYCGHFHQNKVYNEQYEIIYQELRQIK